MYPEQLITSIWDLRKFDGGADTIKTLRDMTGTPESYTHHKIGGYPSSSNAIRVMVMRLLLSTP